MKLVLSVVLILLSLQSKCQTFTDNAISLGVTNVQSSYNHFGNGMTFYDFDEDGWDDLTMPSGSNSIILYKNVNGSFQQLATPISAIGQVRTILWVDYDEDDDLDLCVTYALIGVRIYQNDGNFNFTDVTSSIGVSTSLMNSYSASFADYNNDGYLDFYLTNYSGASPSFMHENILYQNQGDGTFSDVTNAAGVGNGVKTTFMAMWYDFDEDDDLDLHLINDHNTYSDALYRNNGNGTFTDISVQYNASNSVGSPMGIALADYNHDQFIDVFITDIGSSLPSEYVIADSKLFSNENGALFTNQAQSAGVDTNLMGWGAVWLDYDNNGYEDLYVATSKLVPTISEEQTSLLFYNNADGTFKLINDSINGDILCSSYAPVKGDINNDGFNDIVVLNDGVESNVLLNSGNTNNYIKITPVGTVSNKMAIGTKIKVYTQGIPQYRIVTCGSGLCSQDSQHHIFGLGDNIKADSIEISFPSGIVIKKYLLDANQSYEVVEQLEAAVQVYNGINQVSICQGDSITIGTVGYSNYLWNNGSYDTLLTVYAPGTYYFLAESVNQDTLYISDSITVVLEQTPLIQTIVNNSDCGLVNAGSVELLFVNQQSSDFDISWSNGDIGVLMDSVNGGVYNYEIISLNNCVYEGTVTVTNTSIFNVQYLTTPVTNDSLGAIQIFIFGGVAPFEYTLAGNLVSDFITDLDSGAYNLLITDANGCEVLVPFTIAYFATTGLMEVDIAQFSVYEQNSNLIVESVASLTNGEIKLYNIEGKVMASKEEGILYSPHKWIMRKDLENGIYIIYLKINGTPFIRRIFID